MPTMARALDAFTRYAPPGRWEEEPVVSRRATVFGTGARLRASGSAWLGDRPVRQ
ncbi:hypothetical protein [Streptomyces violascens]|uniref:hypothetical protein n=1 Tax=Streptomyces violascens TaxID=67381 RepID=UPI00364AFAB0